MGPAALPRFWRPLGLGPKALPSRSLCLVATSPLRLHLTSCGDRGARTPPGGELVRPRRRPAGSGEGLGLLSGLHSPGRSRAAAAGGARSFGDASNQAENRALRAGARAACGFPAGPARAPGSSWRRRGDTVGRGRGEERAERGRAPGRPGLAGPRLRQSAGADAGGGSAALGYQPAGRGAPGARPCGRYAPGRPAAPARSRLRPARPLALLFPPQSLQLSLPAAA